MPSKQLPQLREPIDADGSMFAVKLEETIAELEASMNHNCNKSSSSDLQNFHGLFKDQTKSKIFTSQATTDLKKLYKTTGFIPAIARSHVFEAASVLLVVASCIWIAVDLDHNSALFLHEADTVFQLVANFTCFFFAVELLIRFLAYEKLRFVLKDYWLMFDAFLVAVVVTETWVLWLLFEAFGLEVVMGNFRALVVLRAFRLMRILRVMKLLHHLHELVVILRGVGTAIRTVSLVFLFLLMVIYVAAIIFRVLLEDSSMGNERFSSVPQAMGTLLVDCVLSGTKGGPLMRDAYDVHPIYSLFFFLFALLANVAVMGVLGAVLVQTIKKIAETAEEAQKAAQNASSIESLWAQIVESDENGDGFVTREEFLTLLSQKNNLKLLKGMDVDPESVAFLAEFVFEEHRGRLSQFELKQWLLDLRSSQKSTMKDHYVTQRYMSQKLTKVLSSMLTHHHHVRDHHHVTVASKVSKIP